MDTEPTIDALLPLPTVTFHVLVALAARDLHGYAILQDIAARTGGAVSLGAGSLYRSLHRMLEQGLVEELAERPDPEDDDERRRYYRLTDLGRSVARAEANRLERLVALARAQGLAPGAA